MPIPAGARQSRPFDAEHEADIAEADFGDEPLTSGLVGRSLLRMGQDGAEHDEGETEV